MKEQAYYKGLVDTITAPKDCVEIAIAINAMAHHNKNLLSADLQDGCDVSAVLHELLKKAVIEM